MKNSLLIFFAILILLAGCSKKEEPILMSGTDYIETTTYMSTTYYRYGFMFSTGQKVSTIDNGRDIVSLVVNSDNPDHRRLTLQVNNYKSSFYKAGDFADEASSIEAFNNLKTVSVSQWEEWADPITENQVWIYRTGSEAYAKFRIISTVNEMKDGVPYGKCTFQWLYQPDGSVTFPDK